MSVSIRMVGPCVIFLLLFVVQFTSADTDSECTGEDCNTPICMRPPNRCDGDNDCGDMSDELNCRPEDCKEDFNFCNNKRCAHKRFDCTGFDKCGDNSRNLNCSECRYGSHRCASGRCVRLEGRQRTPNDVCEDGTNVKATGLCPFDKFQCSNGGCIISSNVCDGDSDCPDGSDEHVCNGDCAKEQGSCSDGRCVTKKLDCTGFDICGDGSRNKNCPECVYGAKLCPDKHCVRPHESCDLVVKTDCVGAS